MAIESGARPYVRITGTGQPEIIQPSSGSATSTSNRPSAGITVGQDETGETVTRVTLRPGESSKIGWEAGEPVQGDAAHDLWVQREQVLAAPGDSMFTFQGDTRNYTRDETLDIIEKNIVNNTYTPYTLRGTITPAQKTQGIIPSPVEPIIPKSSISQGIADLLGISRMDAQEPFVIVDQYGNPNVRQEMYEKGLLKPGVSLPDISVGMLSTLQAPFFMSGVSAGLNVLKVAPTASMFIRPVVSTALAASMVRGVVDIAQEENVMKQQLEIAQLAAMIYMGGKSMGAKLSNFSFRALAEKIPRSQEVTYFKETGAVTSRNVYNILGKDVRSPFYKYGEMQRGIDFFEQGPPKTTPEPMGIAQGPRWTPSTQMGISTIYSGKIAYAEPMESILWQPKTGIPEPYVKTGLELVVPKTELVVRPFSSLVEYDPIFQVADPYVTEVYKNLDILNKNWQPKTGIPYPVEVTPKILQDVVEGKRNPLDVVFKTPEPRIITTKIGLDAEGKLVGTKYGLTEQTSRRWQPLTGTYEQPPRTGKELWTTVFPKPTTYIPPGKLTIYEPMLDFYGKLESGQTLQTEGLLKLVSTKGKLFTLKDLIKPVEKTTGGISQGQKGGQETILIMQEPATRTITELVKSETEKIVDMYTESESMTSGAQRQSRITISEQKKTGYPFQEFKPMATQKQDTHLLSVFQPMSETRQKEISLSDIRQEQAKMQSHAIIPISLTGSLSLHLQGQMVNIVNDSKRIQDTVTVSIDSIKDITQKFIDKTITVPENPFEEPPPVKPRVPIPSGDEDELMDKLSGPQSFILKLRSRQYRNGERIADRTYHPVSKPLSFDDAMSLGVNIVSNSEKASFELEESFDKPGKLGKDIEHWTNKIMEYDQTKSNRWVEMPRFRIDSPTELREITMKGISARMKL